MMKYRFFIALNFFSVLGFSQSPSIKTIDKLAKTEKRVLLSRALSTPVGQTIDIKYESLSFYIDSMQRYIRGSVRFVVQSTTDNNQTITLNLDGLSVDSIISNEASLSFSHDSDVLSITLNHSLAIHEMDTFTIYYQGIPQVASPYFICEKRNGNTMTLSTMSESYSAKYWMPVKQVLSDKIDSIDIYIRYPKQYSSSSNGLLVESSIDGNYKIDHWHHRYPINYYLIAFAITNYDTITRTLTDTYRGFSMPVVNYLFPEQLGDTTNLPNLLDVIRLYDSLFISYPFKAEHYAQTHFLAGGGMEHQTNSFVKDLGFELTAHELAHQWFGDYITCNSWKDIWLNEGFATYLSALSYEHLLNGRWWPVWKQLAIDKVTSSPYGSVYCTDTTDENRIFDSRLSYYKGAMVLHMLRWVLGDSTFFSGIRQYLQDSNLAWKTATTDDLVHHLEVAGDTDLTEFMADWFYGNGYPTYTVSARKITTDSLQFFVQQKVSEGASTDFFKLPVELTVYTNKTKTTYRFNNDQNNQLFTVYYPQMVDSIHFNESQWIVANFITLNHTFIQDSNAPIFIKLYPNPVKETLFIEYPEDETLKTVSIYTANGQCIKTTSQSMVDTQNWASGFYLVKIETGKRTQRSVILVTH